MKIVISCTDGNVSIMSVVNENQIDECISRWQEVNQGKYKSHRKMPDEAVPTDRAFREAWEDSTTELVVDVSMTKAVEIHKDRLRAMRSPLMTALDIEYMQADELGDVQKKAQIAAKKQVLRDVTKDLSIATAKTPDELKKAIPVVLQL